MKDKNKKNEVENKQQKPSKKGRYAEKLNLKMEFNEALKKAVNTKVKSNKKI